MKSCLPTEIVGWMDWVLLKSDGFGKYNMNDSSAVRKQLVYLASSAGSTRLGINHQNLASRIVTIATKKERKAMPSLRDPSHCLIHIPIDIALRIPVSNRNSPCSFSRPWVATTGHRKLAYETS